MNKPLYGEKIAILAANGFCEQDMTTAQRALIDSGANVRVVAMEQGLINGWDGQGWGLSFAADAVLSAALAADFEMLVIPGGSRSVEKLKLTAHTRRFISGFLDAGKPVAVFGDALDLLIFAGKVGGRIVTGPATLEKAAVEAGAEWSIDPYVTSGNLITGGTEPLRRAAYVAAVTDHFIGATERVSQAA
jgi:protease I